MKHLLDVLPQLKGKIKEKNILLFLDYDGTLAPIAKTPKEAALAQNAKVLLKKLSESVYCKLAIISGRSLNDIKERIGLKNVVYAGNHGLEIEGPKLKFKSWFGPRLKSAIRHITEETTRRLSALKGIIIEDKGLTLSVHYRLAKKKDAIAAKIILNEIISPYLTRDKIKINSGKKVYEIKPSLRWDKGRAVLWLLAREKFVFGENMVFPIYVGDDVTDEDAFKVLKNKGLTVFVGRPKPSYAQYYLRNPEEVLKFLKQL